MTYDELSRIALAWAAVEVGSSYGTPALKVRGHLLARLREDGDTLVVSGVGPDQRAHLIESEPDIYYVTDHYLGWPAVLVRLSRADPVELAALLRQRWREIAPKREVAAFDASHD
ncbi:MULTISPECIES: MmcQ/YjbR family DNA-binding protein [Burkholderia]|uniref:MmcQ/YjbR family DNA-binding protein n=1 Tax=Burkholderia TaxID=32008 RepID=UPI00119A0E41|nr:MULTISPECIES: MmcQ/YjbR family DNA-binding protein [Burkholderia]MDN7740817.1 MmcQ/YjbR family DNA-binding protein [Burkholderia gladioli]TWC63799.1 hypothetical protein FB600_117145 [Burkholderia sp. SJZ089]TWC96324.1 hypothetical protein FBX98_11838 [Burkholderia sp. SJZ115]TWC98476.1 hypothetical protein FB601_121145 [Burkholderia sp. SJZ091]